ncbi:MAG: hypothetical protein V4858_19025 [Pseudomonadota bacterium]
MSNTLLILGCSVFAILGAGHAALMLFSTKFEPRDPGLLAQLKNSKAGLSKTGNLWNGIKGFHLSHSLGLVLFGAFYTTLALENPGYLQTSAALNLGLLLVPVVYIYLAHRFWFSVPRNCFVVALGLLLLSMAYR